ncbi:MAG TPA: hypothetical protein VGF57_00920, partial [Roseiarcus sp.]
MRWIEAPPRVALGEVGKVSAKGDGWGAESGAGSGKLASPCNPTCVAAGEEWTTTLAGVPPEGAWIRFVG